MTKASGGDGIPVELFQILKDDAVKVGRGSPFLPQNHVGVITHTNLEPDILKCEVKWALESITKNKISGGDKFQLSYFKS